jgi:hypothetical protein
MTVPRLIFQTPQKILRKWDINEYENKRILRPEERRALMKGDITR